MRRSVTTRKREITTYTYCRHRAKLCQLSWADTRLETSQKRRPKTLKYIYVYIHILSIYIRARTGGICIHRSFENEILRALQVQHMYVMPRTTGSIFYTLEGDARSECIETTRRKEGTRKRHGRGHTRLARHNETPKIETVGVHFFSLVCVASRAKTNTADVRRTLLKLCRPTSPTTTDVL